MNRKNGVILSYLLMIFEIISTLFLTPFIIKNLGQAEYGVYKLTIAINTYLLLLDLGVGNATVRYISKYRTNNDKDSEKKFLGVVTIYYLIISILILIIGIIISYLFPYIFSKGLSNDEVELGKILFIITTITSSITIGTSAYNNILIAYEKYSISKGSSILQIIIKSFFTIILLKNGFNSVAIVLVNLILTMLLRFYFVFYVLKRMKIKPSLKNIEKSFIKDIIMYSSFILLQMIPTQFNSTIDQILIGSMVVSSSVLLGIYGIGSQIVQYFQSIGCAFTGVLMPGVVKLVESKASSDSILKEMIRIGRIMLMVLIIIWCIFTIEGKEFIYLWAGKENLEAYFVALLLMSVHMLVLTKSIGTQILWAMNEHREQAILKFVIVLLNIVITIMLIKWNPLIGATIGTFISLLLGDIVTMDIILKIKLNISIIRYYKELFKGILPCTVITFFVGIILNFLYGKYSILGFAIKCIIMLTVYILIMFFYGINESEKQLIRSLKIKKNKIN